MIDWHSPLANSFVTVQVVGFPIAFLIRAAVRAARALRGDRSLRRKNMLEAAANVCFAATSIAFAFNIPVGVILLIGGITLSVQALINAKRQVQITAVATAVPVVKKLSGMRRKVKT